MSRFRGDAALTTHATLRHVAAGPRTRLAALERLGQPVVVTRPDGRTGYANRAARDLGVALGMALEAGTPYSLEAAAVDFDGVPLDRERRPSELTRLTGRPCDRLEIALARPDGSVRRLEVTTRRTTDDGPPYGVVASYASLLDPGAVNGHRNGAGPGAERATTRAAGERPAVVSPGEDVAESRDSDDQRSLRRARELFATAFHQAPIGMAVIDPAGHWLQVNQALCVLLGHSETELKARTLGDVTHPADLPAHVALIEELLAGRRSTYQLDKRCVHADGHAIWASVTVSLLRDDIGDPLHLVIQIVDITERHQSEQRLQHLADHDPLTGVLNRRRFEEELIRQLDRCRRYDEQATLVMIDLDRFKDVNDSFGQAAGDEALQSIAAALLGHVRSSDVLARVGGDEFAALLVGVGAERAAGAVAGLAAVVRELDGVPAMITASAGATVLGRDDHADGALLRADEALHRVKREGRDGSSVTPGPPPASVA